MSTFEYSVAQQAFSTGLNATNAHSVSAQHHEAASASVRHDRLAPHFGDSTQQSITTLVELEKQQQEARSLYEIGLDHMKTDIEAADSEAKALNELMESKIKCIEISEAIMDGDKVSAEDHKFLMENDPELYMLSLANIRENDDPKKRKVLEDEKEQSYETVQAIETAETGGGATTVESGVQQTTPDAGVVQNTAETV